MAALSVEGGCLLLAVHRPSRASREPVQRNEARTVPAAGTWPRPRSTRASPRHRSLGRLMAPSCDAATCAATNLARRRAGRNHACQPSTRSVMTATRASATRAVAERHESAPGAWEQAESIRPLPRVGARRHPAPHGLRLTVPPIHGAGPERTVLRSPAKQPQQGTRSQTAGPATGASSQSTAPPDAARSITTKSPPPPIAISG